MRLEQRFDSQRGTLFAAAFCALLSLSSWSQLPRASKYADALGQMMPTTTTTTTAINASNASLAAASVVSVADWDKLDVHAAIGPKLRDLGDWIAVRAFRGRDSMMFDIYSNGDGVLVKSVLFSFVCAFLALAGARSALGCSTYAERTMMFLAWTVYYLSSQLDDYQHHWALCLLLFLHIIFGDGGGGARWGAGALRLVVSVLYFWTAIAKCNPHWLSGLPLRVTGSPQFVQWVEEGVGGIIAATIGRERVWILLAAGTIAAELFLAVGFLIPRLWPVVLPVGVGMHITFEFSGISIGHFSYLMAGLYVLVLPETLFAMCPSPGTMPKRGWLGSFVPRRSDRSGQLGQRAVIASIPVSVLVTFGTVALLSCWRGGMIGFATSSATGMALLFHLWSLFGMPESEKVSRCIRHSLACILVVWMAHHTTTLQENDVEWAHFFARHGNISAATARYENLLEIEPGFADGHADLAVLYSMPGTSQSLERALFHNSFVLDHLDPAHLKALAGYAQHLAQQTDSSKTCEIAGRLLKTASRKSFEVCSDAYCELTQRFAAQLALPLAQNLQQEHCGS